MTTLHQTFSYSTTNTRTITHMDNFRGGEKRRHSRKAFSSKHRPPFATFTTCWTALNQWKLNQPTTTNDSFHERTGFRKPLSLQKPSTERTSVRAWAPVLPLSPKPPPSPPLLPVNLVDPQQYVSLTGSPNFHFRCERSGGARIFFQCSDLPILEQYQVRQISLLRRSHLR